jgi:2-polyprenyl-3-methyl-5-hydroxy-6-metoxy-1,4-benzoquinol methylase
MINSLERIIPDLADKGSETERAVLLLHVERYDFAGKHLKPGIIFDIACGVGYGSYFLANKYENKITKLVAVDIDEESIVYAKKRYQLPQILFCQSDACYFMSPEIPDTIISMETIEHLEKPGEFVKHLASMLKHGGRIIASAPITPSMDANPYHLQDFTRKSFKRLFREAGLKEVHSTIQYQKYNPFALLLKKQQQSRVMRKNMMHYYFKNPSKFFLRIKSILVDGFANKYLFVVFEKV